MKGSTVFAGAAAALALTAGTIGAAGAATATGTGTGDVTAKAPYQVWATDVNVRDNASDPGACDSFPSPGKCPDVAGKLQPGQTFEVHCQRQGQNVNGNDWWVYVELGDMRGFIASHYVDHPANKLPDVPVCGQ